MGYYRKYAITVLKHPPVEKPKHLTGHPFTLEKALDYPYSPPRGTHLNQEIKASLSSISRSTLTRRIKEWPSPKPQRALKRHGLGMPDRAYPRSR
ncbi:MAG: hypothetical protein GX493_11845 [Firmicutes bacterium]|nr:hypothetical protein [Bacillota bacterium]